MYIYILIYIYTVTTPQGTVGVTPNKFFQRFFIVLHESIVKNWLNWSDFPKHYEKLVKLAKLVFPKPPYSCVVQYSTLQYRPVVRITSFLQWFLMVLSKSIVKNWSNWSDFPKRCKKQVKLVKLVFPKPPYSCGVQYSTVQYSTASPRRNCMEAWEIPV